MSRIAVLWLLIGVVLLCRLDGGSGFTTCNFYYWRTSWSSAERSCRAEAKELMCYKSRKEVDDITAAFKLSALPDAKLEIWIASRNCSSAQTAERCLSLHIEKNPDADVVWHYFQVGCDQRYPFICCASEAETTEITTQSTSSSTQITSATLTNANSTEKRSSTDIRSSTMSGTTKSGTTKPDDRGCRRTRMRGISWPDMDAGHQAVRPCPGHSIGNATWCCEGPYGLWNPSGPNMSQCRSLHVLNFKEKLNSSSATEAISSLMEVISASGKEVFGEDLVDLVTMMTSLPDRLADELVAHPPDMRRRVTRELIEKSTTVVDYMINMNTTWKDIDEDRRLSTGSNMLATTESFALLLANAMEESAEESIVLKNMGIQIRTGQRGQSACMPLWPVGHPYQRRGSISLSEGYDSLLDRREGPVALIFMLYKDMRPILEREKNDRDKVNGSLNSAIVSATVSQHGKSKPINGNIQISMENIQQDPNDTTCVFWNLNRNNWDTNGCHLHPDSNATRSVCVCDHLTNFAILMDYNGALDDTNQVPFFFITVIGCSISIISLAICIFFFTCYSLQSRHAWGLRYSIHRNLCITLLIANIVFVTGVDQVQNKTACAIVAGCLHYFFLSAFSWMLLEAVHIYLLLVIVFASRKTHWEKYYIFGYGFPLVVVLITVIWRREFYGNDKVCWLSIEKGTIWAFHGPVAAILLVNSAALFLAQWKASRMTAKDNNVVLLKRWLRVTIILFPVLGITWLFGFLYIGKHFVVNAYIFAVLNSLQGFCIFIFHCLMDQKARSMFMASIRKKRTSVNTGSSGTQRKPKPKDEKATPKPNTSTPQVLAADGNPNSFVSKAIYSPMRRAYKRHWGRWHRPWSFCFDVSGSEDSDVPKLRNGSEEELPKAVVVHWNSLPENAAM